jgi:uncharacterized coiled-coil DUF342 family protein
MDVRTVQIRKEGMSTAQIWTDLYRAANRVPSSISDKDLATPVALDVYTAKTRHQLQSTVAEYSDKLNHLNQTIDNSMIELGRTKATLSLRDSFAQEFNPLRAELLQQMETQKKLGNSILENIQEQHRAIPEFIKQFNEGKISKAELLENLEPYRKKQDKITLETARLLSEAESLWQKLDTLHHATSHHVQITTGMQIPQIQRPIL